MSAPRCSACDRFAIVEIEEGFFLCSRCHTILKREFPHVGRQFTDPAVPTPATAASESATNAVAEPFELASDARAPQSGSQLSDARNELAYSLPDIPDFLDRRIA